MGKLTEFTICITNTGKVSCVWTFCYLRILPGNNFTENVWICENALGLTKFSKKEITNKTNMVSHANS